MAHDILQPLIDRTADQAEFVPMCDQDVTTWWAQRPRQAFAPVQSAAATLSTTTTARKVKAIWQRVKQDHPSTGCVVVTDPAEIAWLLNLRGFDTPPLTTFQARLALQKRGHMLLFRDGPF